MRRVTRSINPDIMAIKPRPPICINTKITACPKVLQVETVGSVTSPVTHVDVVAVKSASKYGTLCPVAELIGNTKRILPIKITPKKLNKMICVVENLNLFSLCKVLTSFRKSCFVIGYELS